jgi:hypothetical protein
LALSMILWLSRSRVDLGVRRIDKPLLVILLLALLFRAEPYLTVLGGSDEGIYVNMSRAFETMGASIFVDQARAPLSPQARTLYDSTNQLQTTVRQPHRFEGIHLPGVDIKDLASSTYVFQFYPLHPLWMAIGARLLGDAGRVYSLVFFSLLSIVGFFLLTRELAGGVKAPAYAVALLLAVHPTHAFFSKFPVTEVILGGFSSLAFYYLLKFYRAALTAAASIRDLLLSAGLLFCLFFTHLRGFVYLPILCVLAVLTTTDLDSGRARRLLILYWGAVLVAFSASLFYGLHYTFPYFDASYPKISLLSFGNPSAAVVSPLLLGAAAAALLIGFRKRMAKPLQALKPVGPRLAALFLFAALLLAAAFAVLFSWSEKLAALSYLPGQAGHGFDSFQFSILYMLGLLLSPIGFALLAFAAYRFRNTANSGVALLMLWIGLGVILLLSWTANLPDYIRTRYVLAEILPYSLALISLALGDWWSRTGFCKVIAGVAVALMAAYFCYFTSAQFGAPIKDEQSLSLKRIASHVGRDDVLFVEAAERHLAVPFSYYYGKNVIRYEDLDASLLGYSGPLLADYKEAFVLTTAAQTRRDLSFVDSVRSVCLYFAGANWAQAFPVSRTTLFDTVFRLYRLDKHAYKQQLANRTKVLIGELGWTSGDLVTDDIGYRVSPGDRLLVLSTSRTHPFVNDPARLDLHVVANGTTELAPDHAAGGNFYFRLPGDLSRIDQLRIQSSRFVPRDLGINADTRSLGIDVKSVTVE